MSVPSIDNEQCCKWTIKINVFMYIFCFFSFFRSMPLCEPFRLKRKTILPWKKNRFTLNFNISAISPMYIYIYIYIYLFLFSFFRFMFLHVYTYIFFHFCYIYVTLSGWSISAENGTISRSIGPMVHCWKKDGIKSRIRKDGSMFFITLDSDITKNEINRISVFAVYQSIFSVLESCHIFQVLKTYIWYCPREMKQKTF
jgi:hypothetical protein